MSIPRPHRPRVTPSSELGKFPNKPTNLQLNRADAWQPDSTALRAVRALSLASGGIGRVRLIYGFISASNRACASLVFGTQLFATGREDCTSAERAARKFSDSVTMTVVSLPAAIGNKSGTIR
jgi:hypothetical protein